MDPLLEQIIAIPSVSGSEQQLKNYLDTQLKGYVETIKTDALGNNIKRIGQGKISLMLAAHCDEVGFIVTYIDEKGFIYFKPIGGIQNDIAIGQKIKILTENGPLEGVIGRDPSSEVTKQSHVKDMWIDIGTTHKRNGVKIGNRIYFDEQYKKLENNCIMARGADNKAGVYAATQITKQFAKHPNAHLSLFSVLTTQEEIDMGGAQVAVDEIAPNYACIIDTIDATDTPDAQIESQGEMAIGKGPVVSFGASTDDAFFRSFQKVAETNNIPLQIIAEAEQTSTDTDKIQTGSKGVKAMVVYIPVRYMHTPHVLCNLNDIDHTIQLLSNVLEQF